MIVVAFMFLPLHNLAWRKMSRLNEASLMLELHSAQEIGKFVGKEIMAFSSRYLTVVVIVP